MAFRNIQSPFTRKRVWAGGVAARGGQVGLEHLHELMGGGRHQLPGHEQMWFTQSVSAGT